MRKYILFIVLNLFFLSNNLFAQWINNEECKTPSSPYDFLTDIAPENFKMLSGTRVVKIVVIIYTDDDGSNQAISEENLKLEITASNNIFNLGSICLTLVGIDIRNSSNFNNPSSSSTNYANEIVTGAFTVFIVNSINGETGDLGTFGWAPGIPASYMITRTVGFGTRRTFIHEMGHAFGLEHTFKGTAHYSGNSGCDELVDGSNGTTCGDYVSDTPADPYTRCGDNISGCSFPYSAPNCKDANGSSYAPQMNNIMSYWANFDCDRIVFSLGQYARMRSTIDNNATLTSFLAPETLNITNANFITGVVRKAAKSQMNIGNINSAGDYKISGSVQATFSAGQVELKPGFWATPGTTNAVVRILAANCQ